MSLLDIAVFFLSEIYFNNQKIDKALEFIDIALKKASDSKIILDLQISKAQYLRKNGQVEESIAIFENISNENMNLTAKNELFLILYSLLTVNYYLLFLNNCFL